MELPCVALQQYKVTSVLLACGGVIVVAYGGGEEGEHRRRPKELDPVYGKPSATTSAVSSVLATSTDSAGAARSPTEAVEARLAEITRRETGAIKVQVLDFVPRTPAAANAVPKHIRAEASSPEESASNPLLGDLLALFGAITMAAYEMAFKLLGTLPDEEGQKKRWDRAQGGGGSSSGGRRSRAGSRAGSRPTSRHQRVVSGEADDEDEDEEERLLVGVERAEQSRGSKRSSKRGRKERDHVLGLSDDEAQDGGSLAIPKQSTERSAIWSPSGDGASPSAPDGSSARVPPDYGSGASSPFLSIENGGGSGAFGGSSKQRASSAGGSSSRRGSRGAMSDPLSVEAVKDRLQASDQRGARGDAAAGVSRPRQSRARSALVSDEEEEDATETETETESVLQSGDEEEILAGGTRLGRNRPLSRTGGGGRSGRGAGKRRTVLFDQDRPYKEDHDDDDVVDDDNDEEQDPDETLRETRPSVREARHHHHHSSVASTAAHGSGTSEQTTWIPPPLPFGLHANIMTTGIGVVTAGTLWIGVVS